MLTVKLTRANGSFGLRFIGPSDTVQNRPGSNECWSFLVLCYLGITFCNCEECLSSFDLIACLAPIQLTCRYMSGVFISNVQCESEAETLGIKRAMRVRSCCNLFALPLLHVHYFLFCAHLLIVHVLNRLSH